MFSVLALFFRSLKLVESGRGEERWRGGFDGAHGPRPPGDGRPERRPGVHRAGHHHIRGEAESPEADAEIVRIVARLEFGLFAS